LIARNLGPKCKGFKKKIKIKILKLDSESIEANDDSANGFVLLCFVIRAPNCFFYKKSLC
jgi:hypothetical protein